MLGDWKEAEQDGIGLAGLQIFLHVYHHEYFSLLFFFSPPVHQISSLASLSCLLGNPEQPRAPREVPKAECMSEI